MRTKSAMLTMICLGMICLDHGIAHAKSFPPITIDYDAAVNMKQGEEVSSEIRITPSVDLPRILVSILPKEGIELVSTQTEFEFDNVKNGETVAFTVTVRLTDPEVGYLNLFVTTITHTGAMAGLRSLVFGYPGPLTNERLRGG